MTLIITNSFSYEPSSKKRIHHKPLVSISDLCKEFNVTRRILDSMIKKDPNAPKPELLNKKSATKTIWYDPDKMRKWYKKKIIDKNNL